MSSATIWLKEKSKSARFWINLQCVAMSLSLAEELVPVHIGDVLEAASSRALAPLIVLAILVVYSLSSRSLKMACSKLM